MAAASCSQGDMCSASHLGLRADDNTDSCRLEGELCFSKRLSQCILPSFWREIITVKSDARCTLILVNSYSSKTWSCIPNLSRLVTREKKNLSWGIFKMCQVSCSNSRNAESLISKAASLWDLQSHIPCMISQAWEMTAALLKLAHKWSVTFVFLSNRSFLLLPWSAFPRSLKGGATPWADQPPTWSEAGGADSALWEWLTGRWLGSDLLLTLMVP